MLKHFNGAAANGAAAGGKIAPTAQRSGEFFRRQLSGIFPEMDFINFTKVLNRYLLPHLGGMGARQLRILDVGYGYLEEVLSIGHFAERAGLNVSLLVGIEEEGKTHKSAFRSLQETYPELLGTVELVYGDVKKAAEEIGGDRLWKLWTHYPEVSGLAELAQGSTERAAACVAGEKFNLVIFRHPKATGAHDHLRKMLAGAKKVAAPGALFFLTLYENAERDAAKLALIEEGLKIEGESYNAENVSPLHHDWYVLVAAMPRQP